MTITKTVLAAALVLAAPTFAAANPNLQPEFNAKTGTIIAHNVGAADAGRSLATVGCSGIGGAVCPDPAAADIAPFENPAFPNRATVKMDPVNAGDSKSFTFPFYKGLNFAPGTYIFSVCVDAGDNVAETNENDNCTRVRHTVKPKQATLKLK